MAGEKKPPSQAVNAVYHDYVGNCRRKNIFWELTLEQVYELTSANCTYCNRPPQKKRRGHQYNGIDRIDHSKGYTQNNVQTACAECNSLRANTFTIEETKAMVKALHEFRSSQTE